MDKTVQEVTSAVISVIVVLGAFIIVGYEIVNGKPVTVPDFVGILIGGVVGSYLTRVSAANGARQAGTAAAQTAVDKLQAGNSNATSNPPVS